MKVGYYTEVAGLGASPTDVTINGKIEVYNRCLDDGGTSNCLALVNFWRTLSNLSLNINAAGQDGCRASANFWAVSQAVVDAPAQHPRRQPLADGLLHGRAAVRQRRLHRRLEPAVRHQRLAAAVADPQQPRSAAGRTRVWNQVFAGVEGAPSDAAFPNPPYTTLATTPVSREKPYLFVDAQGDYNVRVPSAQTNTRGISWADGMTAGRTIPLRDFFVATPSDSVQTINSQLARGKNLLLTPGVYDVAREHRGQARRTRSSSASGTRRSPRSTARSR